MKKIYKEIFLWIAVNIAFEPIHSLFVQQPLTLKSFAEDFIRGCITGALWAIGIKFQTDKISGNNKDLRDQ